VFDHVGVTRCDGAVAEGRLELRPPVISDLDEKVLPLHRLGTPVHLASGLTVNVAMLPEAGKITEIDR
jgi:hypothetical protein